VSHVGICVSDSERSMRFYSELLGFRYASELELVGEPAATLLQLEGVAFRAIYLERDGLRIELLHYDEPPAHSGPTPRPMNQLGFTHLSLRVDDLDGLLERFAAAGVEILEHTRIGIPEAKTHAVFIADPDGTLIELVQQPGD
jgi:lactoylglutathione lyase